MVAFYPAGRRPIKVPDSLCDRVHQSGARNRLAGARICSVNQLPIDLGAYRRFNDGVVNIAENTRFRAQFDPIAGLDVAFDDAVEDDAGGDHRPLDAALIRSPTRRCPPTVARLTLPLI